MRRERALSVESRLSGASVARDHRFPDDAFPAIVAHRGASSTRPENTLDAFEEAIRLGADILEMDVRLTRDGVPVVVHDETVDRTTDGRGRVRDLAASEIAALRAGPPDFAARVPTLAEVLALVRGRAAVALELKELPGEDGYDAERRAALAAATHRALDRSGFGGPALVISFDPLAVAESRSIAPDVPTGFLATDMIPAADALGLAKAGGHAMVLPGTRALDPAGRAFVGAAHDAGLRVGTWTADAPADVRRYLDWGVDAVASNDPAMAVGVLAERR
jgi:glycerophosphoryl diester phosphodiesterase